MSSPVLQPSLVPAFAAILRMPFRARNVLKPAAAVPVLVRAREVLTAALRMAPVQFLPVEQALTAAMMESVAVMAPAPRAMGPRTGAAGGKSMAPAPAMVEMVAAWSTTKPPTLPQSGQSPSGSEPVMGLALA